MDVDVNVPTVWSLSDDPPAGDETLCPPRLTIYAVTLSTSDTVFGDGAVDTAVTATYIAVKMMPE